MQMTRAVLLELMDDAAFQARIAAVAVAAGASESESVAVAVSARLQVAATPNVYSAYEPARDISAISDEAIAEGLRRDAYQDYPVPEIVGDGDL